MKILPAVAPLLCVALPVSAEVIRIPKESGFSGFIGATATYLDYESNLVAGNGLSDLGKETIPSLTVDPADDEEFYFNPRMDLRYTFADWRGQLFLGSQLEDLVRFDFTQRLGYRQEIGSLGILSLSAVFTSFPQEVWDDPYRINEPRKETDRESAGVQLGWYRVLGSEFNLLLTSREVDVDKDLSGQQALEDGLITDAERRLLRRDGDLRRVSLQYIWNMGNGQLLSPELIYTDRDIDGNAVAGDGGSLRLTYSKAWTGYSMFLNGFYGQRNFDEANPLFDKKTDADEYGVNAIVFHHETFGWKGVKTSLSLTYGESDSDVDFHDLKASVVSLGILYEF